MRQSCYSGITVIREDHSRIFKSQVCIKTEAVEYQYDKILPI